MTPIVPEEGYAWAQRVLGGIIQMLSDIPDLIRAQESVGKNLASDCTRDSSIRRLRVNWK